nr:ribonuclease H-like domain-containing protein [Tanacetum cinerariifolium]
MTEGNKKQCITNVKVMNYLLQAIHNDIYNSVDTCNNAKEMFERIKRLMLGSDVISHVRHSRLMDEFDKFTANEGESLESVYERLTTFVNIMDRNNVRPILVSINTKFLIYLQPEWRKYVTMVVAAAKLPILNLNEFDLWKMRIEQYFLMIDYSLYEVILNGDSSSPTRIVDGDVQIIAHTTAEQRLAKKNELKARETLLMALPDKHQSKFNIHKDAKSIIEAIEKRFGVNVVPSVFAASSKATVSTLPNVDSLSDAVIYSFFTSYFSRECRSPRDNRNKEATRRPIPTEVSTSNALVSQCDVVDGYDWSFQPDEEPTNYALMAYASSGSSSSSRSDNEKEPSFVPTSEHVKTPKESVKKVKNHKQAKNLRTNNQKSREINEGYVSFGGNPKGGKISGKDTECVVLSFDYKLPDENHVLLRVPRENNMYNVELKNFVPSGDLTCLFANATFDESNLWHMMLGHINFKTMNKIIKGNQPNDNACIKENLNADDDAAFDVKENENDVYVFTNGSDKSDNKKHDEKAKRDDKGKSHVDSLTRVWDLIADFEEFFLTALTGPSVNAVSPNFGIARKSLFVDPSKYPDDPDMPELEDIVYSDDEEDVRAKADLSNLETNISISPIPTNRIHKDHHVTQIIGDLTLAPQTRSITRMMDVKSAFLYKTIKEEVYVCQPLKFKDPDYPDKVYKVVKALYGLYQSPRACKELASPKQTALGKDILNLFMAGSLPKTIWHFITTLSYKLMLFGLMKDDAVNLMLLELARMGYEKPPLKLTFYKAFFSLQWKFLIHTLVQRVSAKRTAWNEFSCSMASAIICLATGENFNFSNYIFDSMVKNVDNPSKFLMYLRFLQVVLDNQVGDMSSHNKRYTSFAITLKVFANMRRVGKDFSRVETPLFASILFQPQPQAEGEKQKVEIPIAFAPPSPTNAPSPPLQDHTPTPHATPPQDQPFTPSALPP